MPKKQILYPLVKQTTQHPTLKVKGSLVAYSGYTDDNIEYVENKVFDETLTYDGYGRGRSSAVFYFKDSAGATYQMFMKDMNDLLSSKDMIDGKVTGTWTYCKRGQNFGIKLAS